MEGRRKREREGVTKKEREKGREKRRQGGGKISPKALPAAKRWEKWRDQNRRSQQHSTEERPINGRPGECSHSPIFSGWPEGGT